MRLQTRRRAIPAVSFVSVSADIKPAVTTLANLALALVSFALALAGLCWPAPLRAADFTQAASLNLRGDAAGAIREYEQFLEAHPQDRLVPAALFAASNLRADALRDPAGALPGYERILREHDASQFSADAARRRADCLLSLERWNDAGEAYVQALALSGRGDPPRPGTWVNDVAAAAADCFSKGGDGSRAIQAYEEVLSHPLPPLSAATLLLRHGAACEEAGRPADAVASYKRVLSEYAYTEHFSRALAKREIIDAHAPVDWTPYVIHARANRDMQAGDYATALARADSILALSPESGLKTAAEARKIITEMLVNQDFARGRERLVAYEDEHPEYRDLPNSQRFLGYTRDIVEVQAEIAANPSDPAPHRRLGELFVNGRMPAHAVPPLERAHELAPEDAATSAYLAAAYLFVGRFDEADRLLQGFFAEHPDDVDTANRMGYAFIAAGQAERSLPYFRMYAEKAPDDANAHDSYGEGLWRAGHAEEAVAEYEKAVQLDPNFSNSHFMLGQIRRELGRGAQAKAAFARFLDLVPAGTQAEEAREAIRQLEAPDARGPTDDQE